MSDSIPEPWLDVAASTDIQENEPKLVRVHDQSIALFRVQGAIYATSAVCTHEYALLTEGYQDGEYIECPLHQALFHIPSGSVEAGPADVPLRTYEVRDHDGTVQIRFE